MRFERFVHRWLADQMRRKRTCRYGHPWSWDTLYIDPTGRHRCRVCADISRQLYERRTGRYGAAR